jgi:predicted nuclease of predicted toxin-antitoxin system
VRLFADENVPWSLVERFRASGHDVRAAAEEGPGSSDDRWMTVAWRDGRVVLTSDRDYGDLVFRHRLPSRGVIYLRLDALPVPDRVRRLEAVWADIESEAAGRFVTVTEKRVRVRDLPVPGDEEE